MNISDNMVNINISTNNSAGVKANNVNATQNGTVSANAQISQVKEGQIFNGKILDITNNKVSILLDNNKTLYAQMSESVNMNIGDALTFTVKENNGSNVLIKPYGDGIQNMKDNAILKILEGNSISPTEKNYQIAEGLMNNNMPVDKASMQRIMQQSYKYPDASLDTIINLNKIEIPVNEANINQYQSYMSNNHQLTHDITNLSNDIIEFSKETTNQILNQMGSTVESTMEQLTNFNSKLLNVMSDKKDLANISVNNILENTKEFSIEEPILTVDSFDNIQTPEIDKLNLTKNNFSNIESLATKLNVDQNSIKALITELNNSGISDTMINNIINKSETPMQLLNNINEVMINADQINLTSDGIADLLSSDSYNNILSEAIKDKFSLNPKEMDNPKELDDLYNKIYDKTNKLLNAFSSGSNSNAGDTMSQTARNMQQRIDFMQNLNNMFAYAQIPVKLEQNQMNSDLYVYMNKKSIKNTKEDVSALLHLDMDHLGATDVHVSLHGTNVHTRFYVEDEVSAKIIDEHMTMLEKAINDNGFKLTNEVITREPALATDPNLVIKEMLGEDLEKSVKRYSFDMRT